MEEKKPNVVLRVVLVVIIGFVLAIVSFILPIIIKLLINLSAHGRNDFTVLTMLQYILPLLIIFATPIIALVVGLTGKK